jgi:transcriptional regulator with XRE-family HTH domain
MVTQGSAKLADALKPKVMSQAELARRLGVSPQAVSGWVMGNAKPTADLMAKIEDVLGIPMRAWTEPAEDDGEQGAA